MYFAIAIYFLHVFYFTFLFWSYFEALLFDRSRIKHIEINISWCRYIKIEINTCYKINENNWKIEHKQILLKRKIYIWYFSFYSSFLFIKLFFYFFNRFFLFFSVYLTTRATVYLILLSTIICFLTTTLIFRVCIAFFLIKLSFVFCFFLNR